VMADEGRTDAINYDWMPMTDDWRSMTDDWSLMTDDWRSGRMVFDEYFDFHLVPK